MTTRPGARPHPRVACAIALAATLAASIGCARRPTPTPAPAPTPAAPVERVGLPAVPRVVGALNIRVVSPGQDQSLGRLDSTFVFGTVGSGDATLRINGTAVPVAPNGAFLAYLPVPSAPSGQIGRAHV